MTKILIIEDDRNILSSVAEILEFEGYATLAAQNGVDGIQLALNEQPDLILCDVRMPQANGYEVLEAVRDNRDTHGIPFVFITAKTNGADIERLQRINNVRYLSKPFEIDELLSLINDTLDG